jgi:hypothetical protein
MEINNKFNIGQEVIAMNGKKIFNTKIAEIRVRIKPPYSEWVFGKIKSMSGIEIEYRVEIPSRQHNMSDYDWYEEEDIFVSKEQLINKINSKDFSI